MRMRAISFLVALTAGMFASTFLADVASANTGTVAIDCNQVTFAYQHFGTGSTTISETVTVDGVPSVAASFTLNGPTGSDTVPDALGFGTHTVTAFAQWRLHPHRPLHSVSVTETVTCGGIG